MIKVADGIWLSEGELSWEFVRAGGPGGQHVNKASTAVQLRFDIGSSSMPRDVKERLKSLAGRRLAGVGEVVIVARESRSQERNRAEALRKLVELIAAAAEKPRTRKKSRPTAASRERRLKAKTIRGAKKKMRKKGGEE
jgi:ribosome-associated protein